MQQENLLKVIFNFGEVIYNRYNVLKAIHGKVDATVIVKDEVRKDIPKIKFTDYALRKRRERAEKTYKFFSGISVSLILEKSLDAICSASVVYLAMVYNTLDEYEDDRDLAECAVEKALKEINDSDRKEKVSEVLSQAETNIPNDLTHDKTWKENVVKFEKVAKRILSTLGEIWNNPAFKPAYQRRPCRNSTNFWHVMAGETLNEISVNLRNIIIVNKSLLIQALKQVIPHPLHNVHPSRTVSSPRREESGQKRPRKD
ncbi:15414_t:CDS:2, partial [Gigaspora margarita]